MKKPPKKAAHRPLKYGEETIMYRRRVPKSKLKTIERMVDDYLKKFEK